MEKYLLKPEELTCEVRVEELRFDTTEDLKPLYELIGQDRAVKAMEFGLNMDKRGYNIFVAGGWGTGRNTYVNYLLNKKIINSKAPNDWVYVNNFKNSRKPMAISLKNGEGKKFQKRMERAIDHIRAEIIEEFMSRDYENNKLQLRKEYTNKNALIIKELNEIGEKYNFSFTNSEKGLVTIPLKEGKPMSEEEYKNLTKEEYELLSKNSSKLSIETVDLFNKLKDEEDIYYDKLELLDAKTGRSVVENYYKNFIKKYEDNEAIKKYLYNLIDDIIENIEEFKMVEQPETTNPLAMLTAPKNTEEFFDRYKVNLFVDNSDRKSAPIIHLVNPTLSNIVGRIEYKSEMGALSTDFTNIKPGALHNANGGYLVIQAKDLMQSPVSFKALKRCLLNHKVTIENIGSEQGVNVNKTLQPSPIPIKLKLIIVGDFYTYNALYNYDEEFRKLFKVLVDFDESVNRDETSILKIARFIARYAEKGEIRHFDNTAVAEIINYSSRIADNKEKISSHLNRVVDLLYEADSIAERFNEKLVTREHVLKALKDQKMRMNRFEKDLYENFKDGTYLLDVDGFKVGEINGLAVLSAGVQSFGKPSKISVSTYRGKEGLINIEREANQSGPSHDKGVMILNGYMGYKFAQDKPLTLSASIVFEQLYSGVDGDSASSTELYAILSSLSGVPIDQSLAVTGSVNQRGQIQPIGGVNEKIEGFYEVCKLKGFNGKQGVIIPIQNVKNLMLKKEVVDACKEGTFRIYAIEHIDQGIELLMKKKAGMSLEDGQFEEGSVYDLVNKKLLELAKPIFKRATDVCLQNE